MLKGPYRSSISSWGVTSIGRGLDSSNEQAETEEDRNLIIATSPSTPRPRRRSSQQRVSLIAGRVSIAPLESPVLHRADSASSFLSVASTRPPSPTKSSFLGDHSISDYEIEADIGRGAYGLVKRAREIGKDGVRNLPCPAISLLSQQ